jgi:hypothetical protein
VYGSFFFGNFDCQGVDVEKLSGKNALTYLASPSVTQRKKHFLTLSPVANVMKLFTAVSYDVSY